MKGDYYTTCPGRVNLGGRQRPGSKAVWSGPFPAGLPHMLQENLLVHGPVDNHGLVHDGLRDAKDGVFLDQAVRKPDALETLGVAPGQVPSGEPSRAR